MPRLANRGTTNRAPSSAAAFPPFPSMDAQIAEIDGGKTNAAFQRWNAQMRARLEGNSQQDNGRFKDIQTTITRQDGYLESVWTMQAIAGPVVTGMTLFSSIDPEHNTTVSRVTFQADVFLIQTATGNRKQVFSTSADEVKLGDVLTVDLVGARVYIGSGTYNNNNTGFYVDDEGFFSLKSFLSFNPNTNTLSIATTSGSAGGWTINATTLTGGNATLDSSGFLKLGTANDIVYISAVDATYRLWAGNVTAGSATFSVTKAGALFSTSGTIAGWTIGTTTISRNNATLDSAGQLVLGTSNDVVYASATDPTYRLWVGNVTAGSATFSVTKAGAIFATSGNVGGWALSTTTLSRNNATLDSAGQLILGTANDVVYISATDATYRMWAGNVTAGTASFSVTKAGALFSNSGMIGGFSIGSNSLGVGIGATRVELSNLAGGYLRFGDIGSPIADFAIEGMTIMNAAGNFAIIARSDVGAANYGILDIYNGSGSVTIGCDGSTGIVTATSFAGSGSSLTSLNASNISSGTLSNARLPSAISVTSLAGDGGSITNINASNIASGTLSNLRLSFTKTPTADAPIDGYVSVGGVRLATVA